MQNYKRLRVSERARQLIKGTYQFTRSLPNDERFGLVSQMRRASREELDGLINLARRELIALVKALRNRAAIGTRE